jgi:hypothetical protein
MLGNQFESFDENEKQAQIRKVRDIYLFLSTSSPFVVHFHLGLSTLHHFPSSASC